MNRATENALCSILSEISGHAFEIDESTPIGGGCINSAYHIRGGNESYFVKLNDGAHFGSFQAEYYGLQQLGASASVRVPQPLHVASVGGQAILIMEYMPLTRRASSTHWRAMGDELARLHATPVSDINGALGRAGAAPETELPLSFGGRISNATLGNRSGFLGEGDEWSDFFCRHRLQFQFAQSRAIHGYEFAHQDALLSAARALISHQPAPSLVHGDLWAGNAAFAHDNGETFPCFFDPAPYIADGETDLALTELFGGFPNAFYEGYASVRPIDSGYRARRAVYNLYHVLNHYNLFGGGYKEQAQAMIREIISL